MDAQRYRKKPVEIEAMRWDGTAADATRVIDWVLDNGGTARYVDASDNAEINGAPIVNKLKVDTIDPGTATAFAGDYVIRGVQGEFYPCKAGIFEATHEPA